MTTLCGLVPRQRMNRSLTREHLNSGPQEHHRAEPLF